MEPFKALLGDILFISAENYARDGHEYSSVRVSYDLGEAYGSSLLELDQAKMSPGDFVEYVRELVRTRADWLELYEAKVKADGAM